MREQIRRYPVNQPVMPTPYTNPDKYNNGLPAKRFTPTLSPGFRPSVKSSTPLTPRLANSANQQNSRRSELSGCPPRDKATTPDHAFLGLNITPRSGSRSSRRDGSVASPELGSSSIVPGGPTLGPTVLPTTPSYVRSERSPVRNYARSDVSKSASVKSFYTENNRPKTLSRPPSIPEGLNAASSKFFHADQARSLTPSEIETRFRATSKPAQTSASTSTFFYADGSHDVDHGSDTSSKAAPSKRRSTGSSRLPVGYKSPSVLSPRLRTTQLADSRSSSDSSLQPSPNVEERVISRSSTPAEENSPGIVRTPKVPSHPGHRKSCSVDSTTNMPSPRLAGRRVTPNSSSSFLPDGLSSPLQQFSPSPVATSNPLIQLTDHRDVHYTVPQSPIKVDGSPNIFSEGAINARTERKVLDLEISNSSLLAINRTLERELRKQNAELRRYRRLSRSGRLSITASHRSASGGGLSVVSETGDISELSFAHSNDEMSEESDRDSFDEGTASPHSLAEHDSRHRVDDEKQFMLDLAKHQELLIDSQKLNQSLKRCIGWTEELIKEGKRALEYNVHVNDVEIGGRVLNPDEVGEELVRGNGLLSPAAEIREDFDFSAVDDLDNISEKT